jgi:hypothetical protein
MASNMTTATASSPYPHAPASVQLRTPLASASWREVVNPVLIAASVVYLAWSYFALASSIWARFFLLCYLIVRMKPDTIIPILLTCVQVRLLFTPSALGNGIEDPLADVYASLTGYEAYTFSLPPVLFMARAFFAFWERGRYIALSRFPRTLFWLWWAGLPLVIAGALIAFPAGRGWTGGLRGYCVVGTCFFGMLMTPLSLQGLRRLVAALAVLALILFAIASFTVVSSRLLFVLSPIAAAYGYFAIRGFEDRRQPVFGALLLAVSVYYCVEVGTITQKSLWFGALACAIVARPFALGKARSAATLRSLCFAITVACVLVFSYAVALNVAERLELKTDFLSKVQWKMLADRGPIWFGALKLLYEDPAIVTIPNRPYLLQQLGIEQMWKVHTHNLVLDCLREFGLVAGCFAIVVIFGFTAAMLQRFGKYGSTPAAILTIALFSSVVIGGLTLPFMITDRQAEPMLIAAGAAFSTMGLGCSRKQRGFVQAARPVQAVL